MIDKNVTDRNRFINGILFAAAIALLATSIYSVYSAWRVGLAQSRAETASRLMAIRTSPRTTETPGINAWISWSLLNSQLEGSHNEKLRLKQLVLPKTNEQFPRELRPLLNVLRTRKPASPRQVEMLSDEALGGTKSTALLEFRQVDYVKNVEQLLVLTARSEDKVQQTIEDFASRSSTHLIEINRQWQSDPGFTEFADLPRLRSARVARFYVLNEDESLISLPLAHDDLTPKDNRLYLSEGDEFRKNPQSPSFVSNNFYFNFEFNESLESQAMFSGLYLDLGGLGLVGSVLTPVIYNGKRCALGADIAFDMDWEQFADGLSPNLVSHVAHIGDSESTNWNPWNEFYKNVPKSAPKLRDAMRELDDRAAVDNEVLARKSIYLAKTGRGEDVAAIQVNRSTWLLLLVAATEIALPWTTMLLTSLVFLTLVFRIEHSRRNAVRAQRSATGQLQEKQNLLDTMQVPLMVVDPNTDEIVYCNKAAQTIGMNPGTYFGKDIVAPDEASQNQYRQTQILGEAHRRAYGVPVQVPVSESSERKLETRYAIVRSVAVTAPIAALHADERHRLGILFLLEEDVDLALLMEQRLFETRQDEKRRLSGLMNHGVDSLARVLSQQVRLLEQETADDPSRVEFVCWLSDYVSERIQLLSWVLEYWGRTTASRENRIIERSTVERTLDKYDQIFRVASGDRLLRERLHWNNGPISDSAVEPQSTAAVVRRFDWDDGSCFSVPRDGVFGFFLGEALINAVRHGRANSAIELDVVEYRNRNEIKFSVSNQTVPGRSVSSHAKPFGGLAILQELARLSGWSPPEIDESKGRFKLVWRIPTIRRKSQGEAD